MVEVLRTQAKLINWILLIALLGIFIYINIPFLFPLTIAGVFALGLHDFTQVVARKFRMKARTAVILTLIGGLLIFWVPISLAVYRVFAYFSNPDNQATEKAINQVQPLKNFVLSTLQKFSDLTGIDVASPAQNLIESTLRFVGQILINFSSKFLAQLPDVVIASLVFVVVLFVLSLKAVEAKAFCQKYSPFSFGLTNDLIQAAKKSCSVTLFSTFVVGLIQASIIGLGSLIFQTGDFWLVLTVTFFVSFIPVIGAAPVGFLLAILAFLGDRIGAGIGLTIVALFAGTIDNIIKPFLLSGDSEVSAIVAFTCVVGAIIMMGLPGLLIGPVILHLFIRIVPLLLKAMEP